MDGFYKWCRRHYAVLVILQVFLVQATRNLTEEFKKDWCRERRSRCEWRAIIAPCKGKSRHWGHEEWDMAEQTDPNLSFISDMDLQPAWHYSKLFIQSVTTENRTKNFGGDAWRVNIRGTASVAASVYDLNNGTYEVVFLIVEPGTYYAKIYLDYSLCHGLKNPPPDWFRKGNRHGSFQPEGTLGVTDDYLQKPYWAGANVTLTIPQAPYNDSLAISTLISTNRDWCPEKCDLLWDGYGRWVNKSWQPYVNDTFPAALRKRSGHSLGTGVLWVYGDSLNRFFYESLLKRPRMCSEIFRACYHTPVWVYALRQPGTLEMDLGHGGHDIDIAFVMEELRFVVTQPLMDANSALILNAGVHLLKSISFHVYQKLVKGLIQVLLENYRGRVIWKTTTSIGDQQSLYYGCARRFHTEQRIKLFNAYATRRMCQAGFTVLDVYPLTASYPAGTKDGVHFEDSVFYPAEDLIETYFLN